MKHTGKFLASLLLGAATVPAHAIPITFDLAGAIRQEMHSDFATNTQTWDLSRAGIAFNAQIVIDTDLFGAPIPTSVDLGDRLSFRSLTPEAVMRSLWVGGESWDLSPFEVDNSVVNALDSNGPVCTPTCRVAPDQFNLSMLSQQPGPQGLPQGLPAGARVLTLGFSALFGSSSEPDSGINWFDFDEVSTLDQLLQLPLVNLNPISFQLQDLHFDCGERCTQTGTSTTFFEVTSLTRTVASVPEPGTLALLGVGLGLSLALRRRRVPLPY